MPRWDFRCPMCGEVEEHSYPSVEAAEKNPPGCVWCLQEDGFPIDTPYIMQRLPASVNFVVKGFNAKNGYGK